STKNQRLGLLPTRRGKAVSPLTLRHRSPQSTASRRFLVRPYGVRREAQRDGAFSWPDGLNQKPAAGSAPDAPRQSGVAQNHRPRTDQCISTAHVPNPPR
ncbi:MAG TPA: hypothetical protein PLX89_25375, partial [Verrucomicrobiota bacterium]|nr:hypothetical protein [Verrucomicrobiota bacterium]